MKETRLGDFEEVILLLVGILDQEAYAFKIAEEFETQTKRSVSIGAVHSTLNRLGEKGFLTSEMGESTAERGGRRKKNLLYYSIRSAGATGVKGFQSQPLEPVSGFASGNLKIEWLNL